MEIIKEAELELRARQLFEDDWGDVTNWSDTTEYGKEAYRRFAKEVTDAE